MSTERREVSLSLGDSVFLGAALGLLFVIMAQLSRIADALERAHPKEPVVEVKEDR